jgi:hypothetical protein
VQDEGLATRLASGLNQYPLNQPLGSLFSNHQVPWILVSYIELLNSISNGDT